MRPADKDHFELEIGNEVNQKKDKFKIFTQDSIKYLGQKFDSNGDVSLEDLQYIRELFDKCKKSFVFKSTNNIEDRKSWFYVTERAKVNHLLTAFTFSSEERMIAFAKIWKDMLFNIGLDNAKIKQNYLTLTDVALVGAESISEENKNFFKKNIKDMLNVDISFNDLDKFALVDLEGATNFRNRTELEDTNTVLEEAAEEQELETHILSNLNTEVGLRNAAHIAVSQLINTAKQWIKQNLYEGFLHEQREFMNEERKKNETITNRKIYRKGRNNNFKCYKKKLYRVEIKKVDKNLDLYKELIKKIKVTNIQCKDDIVKIKYDWIINEIITKQNKKNKEKIERTLKRNFTKAKQALKVTNLNIIQESKNVLENLEKRKKDLEKRLLKEEIEKLEQTQSNNKEEISLQSIVEEMRLKRQHNTEQKKQLLIKADTNISKTSMETEKEEWNKLCKKQINKSQKNQIFNPSSGSKGAIRK